MLSRQPVGCSNEIPALHIQQQRLASPVMTLFNRIDTSSSLAGQPDNGQAICSGSDGETSRALNQP